ncbi:HSF-type DNA-binding-domain-containing protein [Dipodascopsis tothii]|uniref:HSF-type DNA-binding-domain-containing protein n=1 Tax=Dipodascopsis tothii TaxID=44089 RepID=UPI0034CF5696
MADQHPTQASMPNSITVTPSTGGSSNDFVKKLFKMLEDPSYRQIVRWSDNGDSFVVIETNEFTKSILPRHFKHSNFASFVRQLNKYDFHKVRSVDEGGACPYGESAWEFKHPDFQLHNKTQLDNIKRKAPAQRKAPTDEISSEQITKLEAEIDALKAANVSLSKSLDSVLSNYEHTVNNLVTLQRSNEVRDELLRTLLAHLQTYGVSQSRFVGPSVVEFNQTGGSIPGGRPEDFQMDIMNDLFKKVQAASSSTSTQLYNQQQQILLDGSKRQHERPQDRPSQHGPSESTASSILISHNGRADGDMDVDMAHDGVLDYSRASKSPTVPVLQAWAVAPKILIVDDDATCRRVSVKFLQQFGCEPDIAVDGLAAVNKLNMSKYDLVFMDIIMPNLDGVSATSLIRQFDTMTPIVAMTGNVSSNDVMAYYSHGMIDVLAKPFAKENLLEILNKHLAHLREIKEL